MRSGGATPLWRAERGLLSGCVGPRSSPPPWAGTGILDGAPKCTDVPGGLVAFWTRHAGHRRRIGAPTVAWDSLRPPAQGPWTGRESIDPRRCDPACNSDRAQGAYMRALIRCCLALMLGAGCSGNQLNCVDDTCICVHGSSCDVSQSSCGGSATCSLFCNSENICNGSCGESCGVTCTNNSTCALTVGASATVSCGSNSTCHITCTGECSVSCGGGATCDLKCPSDTSPHSIPTGGQCT